MSKCQTACETKCAKAKAKKERVELRKKCKGKRAAVRSKCKGAACVVMACLLSLAMGCASAVPSSKAQTSTSKYNSVTVNLNLAVCTNTVACVSVPAGGVSISLSDVIGTQVQSADAGRDDSTELNATPTNTSGVTGDKPIDTIGTVAAAGITGGGDGAVKAVTGAASAAKAAKAAETAAACTTGTCPK